jgi:hypothetical protein
MDRKTARSLSSTSRKKVQLAQSTASRLPRSLFSTLPIGWGGWSKKTNPRLDQIVAEMVGLFRDFHIDLQEFIPKVIFYVDVLMEKGSADTILLDKTFDEVPLLFFISFEKKMLELHISQLPELRKNLLTFSTCRPC